MRNRTDEEQIPDDVDFSPTATFSNDFSEITKIKITFIFFGLFLESRFLVKSYTTFSLYSFTVLFGCWEVKRADIYIYIHILHNARIYIYINSGGKGKLLPTHSWSALNTLCSASKSMLLLLSFANVIFITKIFVWSMQISFYVVLVVNDFVYLNYGVIMRDL